MIEQSIIHLLPDAICNQIAAGEVIQRPSSVVKELLENSIDAQSKKIVLVISDGGKDLIQVIDDGIGMSELDARMCLEKHATSKIKAAEDLYNVKTLGFRGEAIPSIISVAHVEIMTRTRSSDIGTRLVVKGSEVQCQEPYVTPVGTNFIVRNLFFNIPVRRTFLKNSYIETQHILKELMKVALANCGVEFVFVNNGKEEVHLYPTTLINRICDFFGEQYRNQLIHCNEEDIFVKMKGYIATPQALRKYKKDSFLFVNQRYIKSQYINQAIISAYGDFIGNDKSPFYFLFLTVDTKDIDINIHPIKIEVKFQNEEILYSFIRNSLRRLLYRNDLPEIDFELRENVLTNDNVASFFSPYINSEESKFLCDDGEDDNICQKHVDESTSIVSSLQDKNEDDNYYIGQSTVRSSTAIENQGNETSSPHVESTVGSSTAIENQGNETSSPHVESAVGSSTSVENPERIFSYNHGGLSVNENDIDVVTETVCNTEGERHEGINDSSLNIECADTKKNSGSETSFQQDVIFDNDGDIADVNSNDGVDKLSNTGSDRNSTIIHVKPCYIVSTVKSGIIFIHQRRAHIRILYEEMINNFKKNGISVQQLLFPKTIALDENDFKICISHKGYLNELGFVFDIGVKNEIVITSLPSSGIALEYVADIFKDILDEIYSGGEVNLFHTLAKNIAIYKAIKNDAVPSFPEMWNLVNRLFLCENPRFDLKGHKVFYIMKSEEISALL